MSTMATAPNATIPSAWRAKARRALTGDMRPEDWRHLISGLLEFFGEEAEEPEHAEDKLAQDRSIKEPDVDGRLHVTGCNICRESVDGYKGSEIPGFASLGLEADIIYQVYRPAEELEKAVETANGIPVLREHKPTSATDHKFWDTIGATGTTARWEPPFIVNDLAIWPAPDIKGIETKEKFNLSPGYRYVPTLQNGEFEGKKFQVRMTKIAFNHIAVVSVGRQGPEVAIDSALELQWALVENAILGLHETDLATRGPSGRV